VITAQTSPAAAPTTPTGAPEPQSSPAAAIHAQADRVDQLSAAILRATAQVSWSGRAADQFRARAAERARECLQLAVALRASAERVHAAAVAATAARPTAHGGRAGGGPAGIGEGLVGGRLGGDEPESGR
jgi:small-conductance mechanosensitive channel